MPEINAIDGDTIEVICENKEKEITKGDVLTFNEDWRTFDNGDTITVEPIKDSEGIWLQRRKKSSRMKEDGIKTIICDDIVNIQ